MIDYSKRLPQERLAEALWVLWDISYGVIPLDQAKELMERYNLKLKKGKSLEELRLAVGRGFNNTYGNMILAREQIADEIDKVCVIARWDIAVANYQLN